MLKKDDDNQMWKTGNSFNKAKVPGQESTTYKDIDNFHTMEQLKQQENAYMATNPTIILKLNLMLLFSEIQFEVVVTKQNLYSPSLLFIKLKIN